MLELSLVRGSNDKAVLLGLGLDGNDGHTRVTKGRNFHIMGGSSETHEQMQEKCIKFNEQLDTRGKQLEELERNEFLDIAAECKMDVLQPANPEQKRQRDGGLN